MTSILVGRFQADEPSRPGGYSKFRASLLIYFIFLDASLKSGGLYFASRSSISHVSREILVMMLRNIKYSHILQVIESDLRAIRPVVIARCCGIWMTCMCLDEGSWQRSLIVNQVNCHSGSSHNEIPIHIRLVVIYHILRWYCKKDITIDRQTKPAILKFV